MKKELEERCLLFAYNKEVYKKALKSEYSDLAEAGVLLFTAMNKKVNIDNLTSCLKILKDKTDFFSRFKPELKITIASVMMSEEEPLDFCNKLKEVYLTLRSLINQVSNEHLLLASITLYKHVINKDYEYYANKANDIYQALKAKHTFLTSGDDFPFATILAVSNLNIEKVMIDMETSFNILKKKFVNRDALQSLSHILAVSDAITEEKCNKMIEIFNILKERKHKFGQGFELSSLGVLGLSTLDANELADIIIEVDDYIKNLKGCGSFYMDTSKRRMYAALITMCNLENDIEILKEEALNNNISIATSIEVCILTTTILLLRSK